MSSDQIITSSREFAMSRLKILMTEIKQRLSEPAWTFKALPKQELGLKSTAKVTMMLGGNRSGKTYFGAMNVCLLAMDMHPYRKWFVNEKGEKVPPRIWVIGLDEKSYLVPILIPMVLSIIPDRLIPPYGLNKKDKILTLTNGAVIIFKTTKTTGGESNFQSDNVDIAWFDEEPPENIYKEVLWRTVDRDGAVIFTMTPTNGMSWTYETFYKPWIKGENLEVKGSKNGMTIGNVDINIIQMSTYDNDYLSKKSIQAVEAMTTSQEEKDMRLHGHFVSLGGKKAFSKQLITGLKTEDAKFKGDFVMSKDKPHFLEADGELIESPLWIWEPYNKAYDYYAGIDPSAGINDPMCISIWRVDGVGLKQVAEYNKVVEIENQARVAHQLTSYYGKAFSVVERNTGGFNIIEGMLRYQDRLYLRETHQDDVDGFVVGSQVGIKTTAELKILFIRQFSNMFTEKRLDIKSDRLRQQIEAYISDAKGRLRAAYGHDDAVMAALLAVEGFTSEQIPVNYITDLETRQEGAGYGEEISNWIGH